MVDDGSIEKCRNSGWAKKQWVSGRQKEKDYSGWAEFSGEKKSKPNTVVELGNHFSILREDTLFKYPRKRRTRKIVQ